MPLDAFQVRHQNPDYVIIELFGGDNNLSPYIAEDLSEMASGAGANVAVIAVTDAFNGPAQVVEVSAEFGVSVLERLGEIDTGDPQILAALLARALVSYPGAPQVAIGFWDHGSGVFDEGDRSPLRRAFPNARIPRWRLSHSQPARQLFFADEAMLGDMNLRAMLHDNQSGGLLTNREAGKMLRDAFAAAGRQRPVDLIFSDTCLNGMVEVVTEFEEFARCVVGSEELEPGDGWDYYQWLSLIGAAPPADGAAWGSHAVTAMEAGYRDRPDQHPVTLSAVSSGGVATGAFQGLIAAAAPFGRQGFMFLDWARSQSQIFASGYDSYDLVNFAQYLASARDIEEIAVTADGLVNAVREAIVANIAMGPQVDRANGLAFWFPSSRGSFRKDVETYATLKFDRQTGWSSYLSQYR